MIFYNSNNLKFAKAMRKSMTPWEKKLWFECLKDLPIHFYRQRLIGNYIVDFYCAKAKLAIELDGSQHYDENKIIYDNERTKFLKSLGITVIRYSNYDISQNFDAIKDDIYNNIKGLL